MIRKNIFIILFCFIGIGMAGCGNAQTQEIISEQAEEIDISTNDLDLDILTEASINIEKGYNFSEDVALILRYDENNNEVYSVIDTNGDILFDMPSLEEHVQHETIYKNGYILWGDEIIDKSGNVIFDWKSKYDDLFPIGDGYYLVKVSPEGYLQQDLQCAVIDGNGNEIIPLSEELGDIVAPGGSLDYSKIDYNENGIIANCNAVVDAHYGTISYLEGYENNADGSRGGLPFYYKNDDTIISSYGLIWDIDGRIRTEIERANLGNTTKLISNHKLFVFGHYEQDEKTGTRIKIYDFQGNLVNEKNIDSCDMSTVSEFEDGKCAFFIHGSDGSYVTMMNEDGDFLFEPIKCFDYDYDPIISEGLLKIQYDDYTTKYIDEYGNGIITVDADCENVGNCMNGYIYVDGNSDGSTPYYLSKNNEKLNIHFNK